MTEKTYIKNSFHNKHWIKNIEGIQIIMYILLHSLMLKIHYNALK